MPSITVLDSTGATQTVQTVPAVGAAAGAASLPMVPATDAYALNPASGFFQLPAAAASNNLTQVKATTGAIKGIQGYNAKTSAVYLKLFAAPSASVTAGTTAATKSLYLPASSAFAFDFPKGLSFATGISVMLTTGSALADNTAVAANDILALNVDYI